MPRINIIGVVRENDVYKLGKVNIYFPLYSSWFHSSFSHSRDKLYSIFARTNISRSRTEFCGPWSLFSHNCLLCFYIFFVHRFMLLNIFNSMARIRLISFETPHPQHELCWTLSIWYKTFWLRMGSSQVSEVAHKLTPGLSWQRVEPKQYILQHILFCALRVSEIYYLLDWRLKLVQQSSNYNYIRYVHKGYEYEIWKV